MLREGCWRRDGTGTSRTPQSELAEAELVVRDVDPGPPVSVSYALTARGESLVPLLGMLGQWASENLTVQHPV
jgi:DNA-binding HxlR family transcriptional regulator